MVSASSKATALSDKTRLLLTIFGLAPPRSGLAPHRGQFAMLEDERAVTCEGREEMIAIVRTALRLVLGELEREKELS